MRTLVFWMGSAALVVAVSSCGTAQDINFTATNDASGGKSGSTGTTGGSGGTGTIADGGGASGQSGSAGTGGAPGGTAGQSGDASAGTAGQADATPTGGSAGAATDGAAGTAGSTTGDADCMQTWCLDSDGDTHGDPNNSQRSCTQPSDKYTTVCDDCDDANNKVYPGQTTCQKDAYTVPNSTTKSYDYDCSGQETECGQYQKATDCAGTVLGCTGSGYLPTNRQVTAGMDAYCGSTTWRQCTYVPLQGGCVGQNSNQTAIMCL